MPDAPTPRPSVWIVEDEETYRDALEAALSLGADVRHTFDGVEGALAYIDTFAGRAPSEGWPDVLLLDLNLPGGMSGLAGLGALRARLPATRVIMLTIEDEGDMIRQAMGTGAFSYLLKGASPDELLDAVLAACAGRVLLQDEVAEEVRLGLKPPPPPPPPPDYGLSPREREVLQELVTGKTQKAMARALFVGPTTVNTHLQRIYDKLDVHTAAAAVAKALQEGLVPPPDGRP